MCSTTQCRSLLLIVCVAVKLCAVCVMNRCVCGSCNGDTCLKFGSIFRMVEVEEKYILGSFMIVSSHDILLLS